MCPEGRKDPRVGRHSPQSCGYVGCPGGADFLTVHLQSLLDELVHHLHQVLGQSSTASHGLGCQGRHLSEDFLVTFVKVFPAMHRDLSAGSVQFFRKPLNNRKVPPMGLGRACPGPLWTAL